ncbi:MAG TPA: SagB family peptide dehydrogenase [Pyrinomonadaceae bacterium]
MSNRNIEIGLEYEDLVLRRPDPLVPREGKIDWNDQPSHFKLYTDVLRLPLAPRMPVGRLRSLKQLMTEPMPEPSGQEPLSYEDISNLLLLTNGLLRRRLDVNWNPDASNKHRYAGATYARPAASGGGRYPCELYLVAGERCGVRAGIYHYDSAHQALERLRPGDATAHIRAASFDHPAAQSSDCFILVSINFWKNHFKYHNFSYHVVTQDLGAMLGTLHQTAKGMGIHSTVLHWFRDEMLNRTLGLETPTESVFAVVALGHGATAVDDNHAERRPHGAYSLSDSPLPGYRTYQRSRRPFRLPLVEQTHQSTLVTEEPRPASSDISRARCAALASTGESIRLAAPNLELLNKGLQQVLLDRQSSSGRMLSHRPLEQEQLSTLLRSVVYGEDYNSDVKASEATDGCTRLALMVNHVRDVPSGVYDYDASGNALRAVRQGEFFTELQQKYSLQNYNLEQPAAVIAVIGSFARSLAVFGNRGIRILNAQAGVVAQQIYLATASLGLGCGAILGFKNIEVNQLYGLADSDQTALLLLLVGAERSIQGDFDYSLL